MFFFCEKLTWHLFLPQPDGADYFIYEVSYQFGISPYTSDIKALVKVNDGSIIRTWNGDRSLTVQAVFGSLSTSKEYGKLNVTKKNGKCKYHDTERKIEVTSDIPKI